MWTKMTKVGDDVDDDDDYANGNPYHNSFVCLGAATFFPVLYGKIPTVCEKVVES